MGSLNNFRYTVNKGKMLLFRRNVFSTKWCAFSSTHSLTLLNLFGNTVIVIPPDNRRYFLVPF